jgi:hypothetical protein
MPASVAARLMLARKQFDALARTPAAADPAPAVAEMVRRSELLQAAQKSWPGVRDDTDPRGVLQGLPQPARGRELFRAGAQSMAKRRNRSRPGDQQGGQSARPLCRARPVLAVAAASAGQRAQPMVPAAHAQCRQAHQAHRHCGLGATSQPDLCPQGRCSSRPRCNDLTNASASRHLPRSARDG